MLTPAVPATSMLARTAPRLRWARQLSARGPRWGGLSTAAQAWARPPAELPSAADGHYERVAARVTGSGGGASAALGSLSSRLARTKPPAAALNARGRPANEVRSTKYGIKIGRKKLADVCGTIRGLGLRDAEVQLHFSQKRISHDVLQHLRRTAALAKGAELDARRLVVAEAFVGRGTPMKRARYHSKGRAGLMEHPKTHLTIVLREQELGKALGRLVSTRSKSAVPVVGSWVRKHGRSFRVDVAADAAGELDTDWADHIEEE